MVLSLFTKLQLGFGPMSCPFPNCTYTQTILIHMLQSPLSSSSSYHSSCTMSSAKSHLTTTVQLLMVLFIFPECPGLAAQLSLASVVTKQRQSVFTIQHPIHSPALPILQHVLFNCDPCQYCVGTFSTSTTSQNFTLHSQFTPASDMPGSNQ